MELTAIPTCTKGFIIFVMKIQTYFSFFRHVVQSTSYRSQYVIHFLNEANGSTTSFLCSTEQSSTFLSGDILKPSLHQYIFEWEDNLLSRAGENQWGTAGLFIAIEYWFLFYVHFQFANMLLLIIAERLIFRAEREGRRPDIPASNTRYKQGFALGGILRTLFVI